MKIVILGAGGRLGAALLREYKGKFDVKGFDRAHLDVSDLNGVREKLQDTSFDCLINASGFTKVDLCETQPELAFLINAEAPRVLAEICEEKGARMIHFSTDYVFDGEKRQPYTEEDVASPISVYGESKLAGEKNVLAAQHGNLVVRVSWVFGPDRPSFVDAMIKAAKENEQLDAVADKISAPTYTLDIAQILPRFFGAGIYGGKPAAVDASAYSGVLHFANTGQCSWQEYAQWALDCCSDAGVPLKARTVSAGKLENMPNWVARRPVYSVLSTSRYMGLTGTSPRTWREAVSDYITRFYSKR